MRLVAPAKPATMTSVPKTSNPEEGDSNFKKARVWDLPTRVFHWLLVLSVCTGWLLGDNLSFSNINWHFYLGYMTIGLLVFRLIWGFIGSAPARLSSLLFSPGEIFGYLRRIGRREPSGVAGHNPIGALSVIAMLVALTVQVATGLISESDDFFTSGPFAGYVDDAVVQAANAVHEINSKILLVLVATHVAALLFYWIWKRENLVGPMLTGSKWIKKTKLDTSNH